MSGTEMTKRTELLTETGEWHTVVKDGMNHCVHALCTHLKPPQGRWFGCCDFDFPCETGPPISQTGLRFNTGLKKAMNF